MTCKHYAVLLSVVLWTMVSPSVVVACPVRVYEAAADRWMPDEYGVTVEYSGELSNAAPAKAVSALRTQSIDNRGHTNVRAEFRKLEGKGRKDQPVMKVCHVENSMRTRFMPGGHDKGAKTNVVWSGPFTDETAARILDSPVRKEIRNRILAGDIAVWVMLDSGNKEKDDETARAVEETLKAIRATMKMPPLEIRQNVYMPEPPPPPADKPIALSLIRVARDNQDETFLATMIRQFLADPKSDSEPVLAPVFGRGMMLKPLVGAGIGGEAIRKITAALLEQCSCIWSSSYEARYLLMNGGWDKSDLPR